MSNLTRPLQVIETEINFYKQQTATGIIEIGKRLVEAKAQLGHGEWGNWLEQKVDFSQAHANKFMRIAREYSNSSPGINLGYKKLFLLLDVPQEEREQFIVDNDVESKTTRQLEEALKARKEAEQKIEQVEAEKEKFKTLYDLRWDDVIKSQEALDKERENNQLLRAEAEKTQKYINQQLELSKKEIENLKNQEPKVIKEEVKVSVAPADYEENKLKLLELERKLSESNAKCKNLEKQVEEVADVKLERIKLTKFRTIMFDMTVNIARSLKEAENTLDYANIDEIKSQSRRAIKELEKAIQTIEQWTENNKEDNQTGGYIDADFTVI